MTQWKVGDKVQLAQEGWYTKQEYGFAIGDKSVVIDASEPESIAILIENPGDRLKIIYVKSSEVKPALPDVYETITINGKLYNLVPVEA